jgi:hypothetical protein
MSIDARISAVTVIRGGDCTQCDNTGKDDNGWDDCPSCHGAADGNPRVRLKLEPREKGSVSGQGVLTIVNPPTANPESLSGLIGTAIWGGSSEIMIGEKKWADRIGYTRIKLINSGGVTR